MTQGLPDSLRTTVRDAGDHDITDTLEAFEVAKIGVWTKTVPDGRETVNSVLCELLDIDRGEAFDMRRVISQSVHADDRNRLEDALVAVVDPTGSGTCDTAFRVVQQDHSLKHLSMSARASFVGDGATRSARKIITVFRDVTERNETDAQNQILIAELNHRVKSILTLVQSVAYQTFRRDGEAAGLFADFQGRLRALGKTHDLLVERRFMGTFLDLLAERILASCGVPITRVTIDGFPLHLGSKQAISLSMVLHELCINSMKYGAFSMPAGHVTLSWKHNPVSDMVRIVWAEVDGPTVIDPGEKGAGTQMIERAVALEFGGGLSTEYAPEGVRCTMTIPFHSFDQKFDE